MYCAGYVSRGNSRRTGSPITANVSTAARCRVAVSEEGGERMDENLVKDIEAFILYKWFETGNEPSIEEVIEKFSKYGVTDTDIAPMVMDDDDE